jgi:predicted DNA-binding transcriptional regulator AlpA
MAAFLDDNGEGISPTRSSNSIPQLLVTAKQASALCGKSIRTWRAWDATGKIPQPIRIGRSIFWRPQELQAWVAAGCPERAVWEAMQQS